MFSLASQCSYIITLFSGSLCPKVCNLGRVARPTLPMQGLWEKNFVTISITKAQSVGRRTWYHYSYFHRVFLNLHATPTSMFIHYYHWLLYYINTSAYLLFKITLCIAYVPIIIYYLKLLVQAGNYWFLQCIAWKIIYSVLN